MQLSFQDFLHIVRQGGRSVRPLLRRRLLFLDQSSVTHGLRLSGDVVGDSVEPVPDRIGPADGCRVSGQDEESGLKGVLGILIVPQHAPADAEHNPAVAADECGEGGLVPALGEPPNQFGVGYADEVAGGQSPAQVL